jgi:hypothetical protein
VCESRASGEEGPTELQELRPTSCQRRLYLYRAACELWSLRQAKPAHLHPGSLFPLWGWKTKCCTTNDLGWRTEHRAPLQPLTTPGGGEGNVQVGYERAERYDKSMIQTNWAQRAKIENKELGWKSKTSSNSHGKWMGTEEIYSQWCRTGDGRPRRLPGVVPRAGTITGNMDRFAPSLE